MDREQTPSWMGPLTALLILLVVAGLLVLLSWTIWGSEEESDAAGAHAAPTTASRTLAGVAYTFGEAANLTQPG